MKACREIGKGWEGWEIVGDYLKAPDGSALTPERILTGIYLLELGAADDRQGVRRLLRLARLIAKSKKLG